MARRRGPESDWSPLRPMLEAGEGQIYGLASKRDQVRDGLALLEIARHFGYPKFRNVVIEPGRKSVCPAGCIIVVGNARMLVEPNSTQGAAIAKAAPVVAAKLADRIHRIVDECCFRFEDTETGRCIVNGVTGERYEPSVDKNNATIEDYGVVRCVFRGPTDSTLVVEGTHRLGTLAAAKVATSRASIAEIRKALSTLSEFDETRPLEILVHARFQDHSREGVYSAADVQERTVLAVYGRDFAHPLVARRRWIDQRPWDETWSTTRASKPVAVDSEDDLMTPRVEIAADLRDRGAALRKVMRKIVTPNGKGAYGADAPPLADDETLELLTAVMSEADAFGMEMVRPDQRTPVPAGRLSPIRKSRKQFFLALALLRMMGRSYPLREDFIRRHFPGLSPAANQSYEKAVTNKLRGRIEEGFGTVFKPGENTMSIEMDRKACAYRLELGTGALVLRLRV